MAFLRDDTRGVGSGAAGFALGLPLDPALAFEPRRAFHTEANCVAPLARCAGGGAAGGGGPNDDCLRRFRELALPERVELSIDRAATPAASRASAGDNIADLATERNGVSAREGGFPKPFVTISVWYFDFSFKTLMRPPSASAGAAHGGHWEAAGQPLAFEEGLVVGARVVVVEMHSIDSKKPLQRRPLPEPRWTRVLEDDVHARGAGPADEALDEVHEPLAAEALLVGVPGVARARVNGAWQGNPHQPQQPHVEPPQEAALNAGVSNIM